MTTGTLTLVMPPLMTVICRSIADTAAGPPEAVSAVTSFVVGRGGATATSGSVTLVGRSGATAAGGVTSTALARSPAPFCRVSFVATAELAISLVGPIAADQPTFVEIIYREINQEIVTQPSVKSML